jgi:hypothetical protein
MERKEHRACRPILAIRAQRDLCAELRGLSRVCRCIPVRISGERPEDVSVLLISSRGGKGYCFPKASATGGALWGGSAHTAAAVPHAR